MVLELKVRLVNNEAILPRYAHEGDAGLDLFAVERQEIMPGEVARIRTGIAIELPENTEAQIRPRSGLAYKHRVTVLNTPGTVDCGYRGEIEVILINHSDKVFTINAGDRIAQMVIKPVLTVNVKEVTTLSATNRGKNGFGSTGN